MEPRRDTLLFLANHAPFSAVDAGTRKIVASHCQPISRRSGEAIFTEGDPCRDLYLLVTGRVKCVRANAEGREQILKVFERPGDVFCATSAFSTGSHIVTAQAMSDVQLYAVDVETMKRA